MRRLKIKKFLGVRFIRTASPDVLRRGMLIRKICRTSYSIPIKGHGGKIMHRKNSFYQSVEECIIAL